MRPLIAFLWSTLVQVVVPIVTAVIGALGVIAAAVVGRVAGISVPSLGRGLGIKITSPTKGSRVTRNAWVPVSGIYRRLPPTDSVYLLTKIENESKYWPQVPQSIDFDHDEKTWAGRAWIDNDLQIQFVLAGPGGRALFRYAEKAGAKSDNTWTEIEELPPDVVVQDETTVRVSE